MSVGVAAHGVTYGYGARRVLEDVSLELRGGELLALVGPNGAGKTTLLKLLAGLLRPRAGAVSAPQPRARLVAYLAQSEPLPAEFTALEVARLGRLPLQGAFAAEGAADRAAVERAMRRTGTLDLAGRRVGTLSGGERQRVALARALAQEPRVLLLDEPTNHLDLAHQAELLRLLRDAANDGVAVAMVVHDLNLAALADRVALLHGGRLEAVGPPGEVLQPHRLERVYGARVERLTAPSGRAVVVFEP